MFVFAIDGPDGAGKTTAVKEVEGILETVFPDYEILTRRFPGQTEVGDVIRGMILSGSYNPDPLTEFLLFAADDRETWVKTITQYASEEKVIVLCDRSHISSLVYQCARGVSSILMEQISDVRLDRIYDQIYVLQADRDVCAHRLKGRSKLNQTELPFWMKGIIADRWRSIKAHAPHEPITLIDASSCDVAKNITQHIKGIIEGSTF